MSVKHEFSFKIQQILHVWLCVIKQWQKMPRIRARTTQKNDRER